jgi:hypothetical protein
MAAFLAPLTAAPAYDLALAQQIQATVAGISGLPGNLVRPRWQPDPPAQPPKATDWCAVGITTTKSEPFTTSVHNGAGNGGDGTSTEYRDVEMTVLASFYGPNAASNAAILRDGFAIQQNRAAMLMLGLAFVRPERLTNASGLVNAENLNRYDLEFTIRRRDARTYAVPNIRTAIGTIETAHGGYVADPAKAEPPVVTPFQAG